MPDLNPGEAVIAEAGAMNYMHDGITFDVFMAASLKAGCPIVPFVFTHNDRELRLLYRTSTT